MRLLWASTGVLVLSGLLAPPASSQGPEPCDGIVFSTEEDFLTFGPLPPDGNAIISDGDLLALEFPPAGGVSVCARNAHLLEQFQVREDLGLDAAVVVDPSDDAFLIGFSTELNDPRRRFTSGDLLITNGTIVPNSVLLARFGLPPQLDLGLDALEFVGDPDRIRELVERLGQNGPGTIVDERLFFGLLEELEVDVWFSTEGSAPDPDGPAFLDGDLLSALNGVIVVAGEDLLAALPAGIPTDGVDYGLDAFTRGEDPEEGNLINLFSTEIVSIDPPVVFTDGDVLEEGPTVFLQNFDLTQGLEPVVRDLGLDALDMVPTVPPDECPNFVKWSQPPGGEGFDAPSGIDWIDMEPNIVTVDDFISDGRPILGVRFWGSYIDREFIPPQFGGGGDRQIDGWLISFHAHGGQPESLLGVYFCPEDSVRITPTNLPACDQSRVFEYCVTLSDCCPLHIDLVDDRDGTTPALPDRFNETRGLEYFIGVQAVVGHTFTETCEMRETSNQADDAFWGWHTSPGQLVESLFGMVFMDGREWIYKGWPPVRPLCGDDRGQAFELLTGETIDLPDFVRGDSNGDSQIDLSDGVFVLAFLFLGGPAPGCFDAADSDDSGRLDLTDAVFLFGWLFLGGPAPPDPMPSVPEYAPEDCGADPTPDTLDCVVPPETCLPPEP